MRALLLGAVSIVGSAGLFGCGGGFKGTIPTPGGTPQPAAGQPVVTGLSPSSVAAGGPNFTLTVTGKNFAQGDTVDWDAFPLSSTFVSSKEMTAVVPNGIIEQPTTGSIVVQRATPDTIAFGSTITVTNPPLPGTTGFSTSKVNVEANDLVWDPGSQQIYLSVAGSDLTNPNTITALDPVTGQLGASVSAGPGGNRLAVSSDSKWLYAGIDASGLVQRFVLPGLASDITIALGSDSGGSPYYAADLETAHGSPETIAVSLGSAHYTGVTVAVFDGSTPRSTAANFAGSLPPLGSLAWNAADSSLYGSYNTANPDALFVFSVDSSGAQLAHYVSVQARGGLHSSALTGYIYTDGGQVFDPASQTFVNYLPENAISEGFTTAPPLTIDDTLGMAWVVGQPTGDPNHDYVLEAFDLRTYALLGSIIVPNVAGTPVKLIRWGSNGLAFLTSGAGSAQQGDGVYLISGDFITKPSVQIRALPHASSR